MRPLSQPDQGVRQRRRGVAAVDCHTPDGLPHARVNDVNPAVTPGVHSNTPSVPDEVADKLNDPAATVVVVTTVVVVVTTVESASALVTLTATSATES